jgi:hypothetical protein
LQWPSVSAGGFLTLYFSTMNQKILIQNEINRLRAYIEQVKVSNYSDDKKAKQIKDSEDRIEKQELELAKLIEVEFEKVNNYSDDKK